MKVKIKGLDKVLKELERLEKLMLNNDSNTKWPEFVKAERAAEILETTTQTLYNHSKKGLFPKYKFGDRTVYYKLSELYAAFKPLKK